VCCAVLCCAVLCCACVVHVLVGGKHVLLLCSTGVFHEVDRAALEAVSVVPSVMPQASTPFLKRKKLTLREAQDRMLKKTRTDMGMPM